MGREIRRVPPNWEHPKKGNGSYHPMSDCDFDTALYNWLAGYELWKKGKHRAQKYPEYDVCDNYWDWEGGPPDPEYYRPIFKEKATWYQGYETVSEGTPVTPPFPNKQQLIDYLVEHGDFWDQSRGSGGWSRNNAENYAKKEWAMTGCVIITNGERDFKMARDGA